MDNDRKNSSGFFRPLMKISRRWRDFRNRIAFELDVDLERKIELYEGLSTSATLKDLVYWLQIIASAGIATLGMVLNSTAVIIGAMLISPLMAPILSQGLALATGDLTLGIRSVVNLILSSLLGILVALILVAFLPYRDATSEILARTEPNTLDLGIALFSGAIGAVATCREVKGVVTSIPGVAIAVALMPPLCVVGYGIGYAATVNLQDGWNMASGGGLLYLTNLVAITFTAMLVFVLLRIERPKVREAVREWRQADPESQWWLNWIDKIPSLGKAREVRSFSLRLLMILIPLLVIFFPLSQSFSRLRTKFFQQQTQNKIYKNARDIWTTYEQDSEGNTRSYLDELKVSEKDGKLLVYLRVFDNRPYTKGEKARYINLLADKLGKRPEDISFQLIEIPTSQREISKPVVETTPTPVTIAQRQANYLEDIRTRLVDFKLTPPAVLIDYSVTVKSNSRTFLEVFYLSEREIDVDGKIALEENLKRRLTLPNVNLLLTRISSESNNIKFKGNNGELDDASNEVLANAANNLLQHASLKLRITLNSDEDTDELFDKRKESLVEFFKTKYDVPEERLVFTKVTEGDAENRFQLFY